MPVARTTENPLHAVIATLLSQATRPARHPNDRAVHEMRRQMKRIRAALRLLRPGLGETNYRRCNAGIRDAAKPLAPVRDAAVVLSIARGLLPNEHSDSERRYLNGLMPRLELERHLAKGRLTTAALNRQLVALSEVQRLLASMNPSCDLAALSEGIRTTYRAGRKAWHRARRQPDDECLHEWRKQVKYLTNQVDLLQETCHIEDGKLHRQARQLGDSLGKDRDLAMLSAKMHAVHLAGVSAGTDKGQRKLLRRIRRERKRLQDKAWRRGKKVFSRSPRRFVQYLLAL